MAKFCGKIGYVSYSETTPGVYEEIITEKVYRGDINKKSIRWENGSNINDNLTINYEVSIVADTFLTQHLPDIKYVECWDAKWKVTNISVLYPRLILTIGGLYNEQTD